MQHRGRIGTGTGSHRTIGIDMAAQAAKTACVEIDWGPPVAVTWEQPADDDAVVAAIACEAEKVGVDCPFGWPSAFVAAVVSHALHKGWPAFSYAEQADELRRRATDRYTRIAVRGAEPLAVSADRIGAMAMRWASIQARYEREHPDVGPVDRAGQGRLVEVYPAAALLRWGFAKGTRPQARELAERAELDLSAEVLAACDASEHVFDAFVCALVARAAHLGLVEDVPNEHREVAGSEGWIRLPTVDSLGHLGP